MDRENIMSFDYLGQTIEIAIYNDISYILTQLPYSVKDQLSNELAFQPTNIEWSPKYKEGIKEIDQKTGKEDFRKWDGYLRLFRKRERSFPTGCLSRIRKVLEENGYNIKFIEKRIIPSNNYKRNWKFAKTRFIDKREMILRYYQEDAIKMCMSAKRGVISHPTGTGKTVTIAALLCQINIAPVVVFVPTIDLLYQTKEEFENMIDDGTGTSLGIGIIGDGKVDIQDITICIIDSAISAYGLKYNSNNFKIEEENRKKVLKDKNYTAIAENKEEIQYLIENAKVVIADECHRAAAPKWETILNKMKSAVYRFGFSATVFRDDGCELKIEGIFGRVLHETSIRTMIDQGFLMEPQIIMVENDDDPDGAYLKYEKKFKERMEEESNIWIPAQDWDYRTAYENLIVYNECFNKDKVAKIAKECIDRDMSVLILVKEKEHGRMILHYIGEDKAIFLSGEDTSKLRNSVIGQLKSKNILCLIATTIADMGLDLPSLDVLILAGGGGTDPFDNKKAREKRKEATIRTFQGKINNYNEEIEDSQDTMTQKLEATYGAIIRQRIGRVVRKHPNKKFALVFDFWHSNNRMLKQSKVRKKIYLAEGLKMEKLSIDNINFDKYIESCK